MGREKNLSAKVVFWLPLVMVVIAVLWSTDCSPVYIPNAVNVPLLGQKGEASGQVSLGTSISDIQTAFSPADHLALMANISFGSDDDGDHLFLEGGAGYFRKFGSAGRYEVYAGYGWGRAESTISGSLGSSGGFARGNYHRFFIQPSIGAATGFFDGAFSLRLVYVDFFNTESFMGTDSLFIEPVLTTKLGFNFIKLVVQAGVSLPLRRELNIDYLPFIFNIGLNFYLRKSSPR